MLTLLTSVVVSAQDTTRLIRDADLAGNTDYVWSSDTSYILDGRVYLEGGSSLTIEPGTIIRATESATASTAAVLVITRDAQIFADGTAEEPIIFTSLRDTVGMEIELGTRNLWGGLVVLGRAPVSVAGGSTSIEGIEVIPGIPDDENRSIYGGDEADDNSGIIRYVSIRYGGASIADGNEINGLTLGGVGSGTIVDFVEVYANLDDGVELFGGTVDVKHAAVSFCGDDSFDYDLGWVGNGQFWFSYQGPPGSVTGRAGEHDGASPDNLRPSSYPTIYNATYVGIGADAVAADGDANKDKPIAVIFRDNAGGIYRNSIFTDFNGGAIGIEDLEDSQDDSFAKLLNDSIVIEDNIFFNFGDGDDPADLFVAFRDRDLLVEGSTSDSVAARLGAVNLIVDPVLNQSERGDDGEGIDPRPNRDGVAASGAPAPVAGFDTVAYYGAFAPADLDLNTTWLEGWTFLATNDVLVNEILNSVGEVTDNGLLIASPFPNPATEQTTVQFELTQAAETSVQLFDFLGRSILNYRQKYAAGEQQLTLNLANVPNGTYAVVISTNNGGRVAQKLVIRR